MIEYQFLEKDYEPSEKDINSIDVLLEQLTQSEAINVTPSFLVSVINNSRLLVARTNPEGDIIGIGTLSIVHILTGNTGRIEDVVVSDEYRGQGIGKGLVKGLINEAKGLDLRKIYLTSRPERLEANLLYQKLGFKEVMTNVYRLDC